MSQSPWRSGLSTEDTLSALMVLPPVMSLLLAGAAAWAHSQIPLLVRHHVLLGPHAHPLWVIPGTGGAGLDLPRLVILGCGLLILVTLGLHHIHLTLTHYRHRKDTP